MKLFKKRVLPIFLCIIIMFNIVDKQTIYGSNEVGEDHQIIPPIIKDSKGKGGLIGTTTPGYSVSLADNTFTGVIKIEDSDAEKKAVYENNFKNKYPAQSNSIFFINSATYVGDVDKRQIRKYISSTGNLVFGASDMYMVRKINQDADKITGLSYSKLYSKIKNVKNATELNDILGEGQWKDVINTDGRANEDVWSYILSNNASGIDTKIKDYLKITGIPPGTSESVEKKMQAAAWVDLVATLYVLSPPNSKQQKYYASQINRYLKGDLTDLGKNPPIISVEPVVTIKAPDITSDTIYMNAIDYLQYLYGATPGALLTETKHLRDLKTDYTEKGWKSLVDSSIVKSLKDDPKRPRITSMTTATGANENAFNYGMRIALGQRLQTSSGKPVWYGTNGEGILHYLRFKGDLYGFIIAYPSNLSPFPDVVNSGRFGITTDTPNKEIVPEDQEVIGKNVTITMELKQSVPEEAGKWKKRLSQPFDEEYPKIKIKLERTAPTKRVCESIKPSITEDNPKLITKAPLYNGSVVYKGDNVERSIDKNELKKFLLKSSTLTFEDDTSLYKIAQESSVTFKYKAEVSIQLSSTEEIVLRGEKGEASKTFSRGKKSDIPDIVGYTSQPSYWSEIKNGEPGNETFEAMAGTPTTRNLYFASGGSEFIVETEFEYVKDAKTTRTYRSHFKGVDSEFREVDNANTLAASSRTLGGQTADLHNGNTYSKEWSGTTSWTGSGGVNGITGWHSDDWDDKPYETALANANKFADTINATTISYTAPSDGVTRTHTGWSASVTSSNPHNYGGHTVGHEAKAAVPPDKKGQGGSPAIPYLAGTYTPGTSNQWHIKVTWTVPAHCICGPSCCYKLPDIEDTWKQEITYDYMKINVARVWKLDKAAVNGMIDITGTDEFKANVVTGDPTIFYNRADPDPENTADNNGNDSAHGRLRYEIKTDDHDTVLWEEGTRTNKDDGQGFNGVSRGIGHANPRAKGIIYTNNAYTSNPDYEISHSDSVDKGTEEYKQFKLRRETKNRATVISDFLILQTSTGDQSILYFDKDSEYEQTQVNFKKVAATREEMWDNNPNSFAKMDSNAINIGSYNGKFYSPLEKYSSYKTNYIKTIFDSMPAGFNRTARPSAAMRLVNTSIDIIDELSNRYYETGESYVFYKNILNIGKKLSVYDSQYNSSYGDTGMEFRSTYSDGFGKINDIVIQNPVSTEFAMVMPLDNSRDQRTDASKLLGGNQQAPTIEIVKRLKTDHPKQNLIYNGNADIFNNDGTLTNWKTWESVPLTYLFTVRKTSDWWISSPSTFEIRTNAGSNYTGVYYCDTVGKGGDSYSFSGKLNAHRCTGYFYIEAFNSYGTSLGKYYSESSASEFTTKNLTIDFTAPVGTTRLRVNIVNGNDSLYTGVEKYVFADDLVLNDNTTTTWQTLSYESEEPAAGTSTTKTVTTIDQAPDDWYEEVEVTVSATKPVNVIAGTLMGLDWKDPDIWEDKYISAGANRKWDTSKSAWKVTGNLYMYLKKEYAPKIDSSKSYSMAVTVLVENNKNKYFYWGGERLDSSKNHLEGYGGTFDYSATKGAVRPQEGVWTTYRLDVKKRDENGYSGWCNDGCKYYSVGGLLNYQDSSNSQITYIKDIKFFTEETYTPGNFINLDYGFQICFPNRGNFYENGAYGISNLSPMRGKGFEDGMDTTEWTKEKYVSFQFNAIYNGVMYLTGEDIPLDINDTDCFYDLYCPLANSEAISSEVTFKVIANNGDCIENKYMANKERGDYLDAKHSGIKKANIDVVGRIGNLIMEDTGDFRFANLFKKAKSPVSWIFDRVVKDVDISRQNNIFGSQVDIRGESVSENKHWLDTYGALDFADRSPISFPLTPDKNNIKALQRQPLRIGYKSLMDVQTIGNYSSGYVEIRPYYYYLNLKTGETKPVDIYMNVGKAYKPINIFGNMETVSNSTIVYNNITQLSWDDEYLRRNYSNKERAITEAVLSENKIYDVDGTLINMIGPMGRNYSYGNNQFLQLTDRNRTFTGTPTVYENIDTNPGNLLSSTVYGVQAQRWHFTAGLPSSAVAVEHGKSVNNKNIDAIGGNTSVLLMCLDIVSIGDTYALQYSETSQNSDLVVANKHFNLSTIPYPIVCVMSSNKSSADDLDVRGTH